jgi:AmpE protein
MKFLVILICLTVNYLWLRDFDRFDDGWFFRFRCKLEAFTSDLEDRFFSVWLLSTAAIYLLPILILMLLLLLAEGAVYGLFTMLIHILVLLIAFDRTQPGKLAKEFVSKWKEGDMEACVLYLQQELPSGEVLDVEDEYSLSEYFNKQLSYRFFEKMFVMFFWYLISGPIGVLACYITYQMRDSHEEQQSGQQLDLIKNILMVLEWLPLRLLALTFSLAGNFVRCFENLQKTFWASGRDVENAELLYRYARGALSGLINRQDDEEEIEQINDQSLSESRAAAVAEIAALQGLLERSQAIWLSLLALITIFGLSPM